MYIIELICLKEGAREGSGVGLGEGEEVVGERVGAAEGAAVGIGEGEAVVGVEVEGEGVGGAVGE